MLSRLRNMRKTMAEQAVSFMLNPQWRWTSIDAKYGQVTRGAIWMYIAMCVT